MNIYSFRTIRTNEKKIYRSLENAIKAFTESANEYFNYHLVFDHVDDSASNGDLLVYLEREGWGFSAMPYGWIRVEKTED